MQNEKKLVQKAKKDKESFLALYNHYFPKLYAFALVRIGAREQAEDAVQQTFLKALENLSSFTWKGYSFGSWLFRILKNEIVDQYRAGGKIYYYEPSAMESLDLVTDSPEHELLLLEQRQDQKKRYHEILITLKTLDPDEREALMLKYVSGMSYKEIAGIIDKKPGTIAVMLHRALKKVREELKESKKENI